MSDIDTASKQDLAVADDQVGSEELLNFSQRIRKKLVIEMTDGGLPTGEDSQKMLLAALRDMDRTSVDRLKVDVDNARLQNDREVQEMVRRIHEQVPKGLASGTTIDHRPDPEPNLEELPEPDFVEGEMDVGVNTENAKAFLSRMDGESSDD